MAFHVIQRKKNDYLSIFLWVKDQFFKKFPTYLDAKAAVYIILEVYHNLPRIFNKKDHLLLFSFDSIHHWHELKYSHLFWNLLVLLTLNSHYIINNQIKIFSKVLQRLNFFIFFILFFFNGLFCYKISHLLIRFLGRTMHL